LTSHTPLLTTREGDESKVKWDVKNSTGLRFENGAGMKTVEYHRDVKPIFERSCVVCHSGKSEQPAGNLVLDDDTPVKAQKPAADTPPNRELAHIGFTGSVMPPPEAVKTGKVKPLSAEDRLILVRWIDLGCPIDLTHGGWFLDDQRPTLALTYPKAGANDSL